jgi:hypothetical protein
LLADGKEAAELLKRKRPHGAAVVKDLQTGETRLNTSPNREALLEIDLKWSR